MKRRVVITGLGPATALGIGKKDFFASIFGLKTCITEIPKSYEENYSFKSRYLVPKPKVSLTDLGLPKSVEGMMEEASKLFVLCTKLALEDAGLQVRPGEKYWQVEGLEECPTIIGIGMSSLQTAFDSYTAHIADSANPDAPRFNRMVIPMLMTNSPAAWISILFALKGFSYTLNASCASGSYAVGEAYRAIAQGRCNTIITGGVEVLAERTGAIMRGFDMMAALTKADDGRPQPFSQQRSGFLFNEGAGCALILEELNKARSRGADIYAEIVGFEGGSDAYSIVQMEPGGMKIQGLLEKVCQGIRIDYFNAHGTGTAANDAVESEVIQGFFGDKINQPYINSTKGILGHSIGASGALEAAVAAVSIKESRIHGNLTAEPLANLNLPLETISAPIKYALSASYGFGGHNAALLFKRYEDNE
ncbi:3-oxoacyl-(acyl-carrier-protein) synthase [Desulfosporosinus orientis DSM 765]|uniref:Nodulation protein E n=1 Tax=Desulfosporosinus orientis (strain ATCC 19365 / DSM 765 / NCIMB 8382 / VKM B-1628 / Singapore I) TaxID=768706 RepID=G7WF64_DESOD|nr:beta-ketoacyl-[acyl-carrier-protein] synthase family protein [Desulfosporosinus orientis]AET67675.1 3-oxoacyl-(acyl-carrier-protein) synthase [Desulfosporosinus orientis DSM 765]